MKLRKKLRVLALMVGAVAALAAIVASPAMAAKVNTKFNASTVKLSGTLTVKKNGAEAKTCELKTLSGKAYEAYGTLEVYSAKGDLKTYLSCTGGTELALPFHIAIGYYETTTGAYTLEMQKLGGTYKSPWGEYYPGYYSPGSQIVAGWTNGSGATPSTINFKELNVGAILPSYANLTVNGSLTATTSTGGLLTLSH